MNVGENRESSKTEMYWDRLLKAKKLMKKLKGDESTSDHGVDWRNVCCGEACPIKNGNFCEGCSN